MVRFPRFTLILISLLLLTAFLFFWGWWQGTAVGPEIQVPMFYDDHYIYPRPWTQGQEAPGVPDPSPAAVLYGPNQISQAFVPSASWLTLITVWLAGPANTPVHLSLTGADGTVYAGTVFLKAGRGRYYHLSLPPLVVARNQPLTLTLSAPEATPQQPVITRTVGGDRLGSSLRLNEYRQPGNLELKSYGRGAVIGLSEQLLPAVFRLRLQQYKPPFFKGIAFPLLLLLTAAATLLLLLLTPATHMQTGKTEEQTRFFFDRYQPAYLLIGLWLGFLGWQLGSGRVLIPFLVRSTPLISHAAALHPQPNGEPRLVQSFTQTLWTAIRKPEPRFIKTGLSDGLPAIFVPADAALEYALTLPLDGHLHVGLKLSEGEALRFSIFLGEQLLHSQIITAGEDSQWLTLPLTTWGGQSVQLTFKTDPVADSAIGAWLMPQLWSQASWLLPDPLPETVPAHLVSYQFEAQVELVGYQSKISDGQIIVTLYWRIVTPTDNYATIFVHLLNEAGEIVSQHDSQPVQNSYPLPVWQPGRIIADEHPLQLPESDAAASYTLAIGLYDPVTWTRWSVTDAQGNPLPDGRILLEYQP